MLTSQILPWLTALGALGGLLVRGGEPQGEIVWQPDPNDLAAAVRAA